MNPILKSHLETGNFSRGYLLGGDLEGARQAIRKAVAVLLGHDENSLNAHPDFSEHIFDSFGLEDVRDLRFKTGQKPFLAEKRVFSLEIGTLQYDAILPFSRILEESPLTCHFFVSVAFSQDVPHLVRSKLVDISENAGEGAKLSSAKKEFYGKFLKEKPPARLLLAKEAVGDRRIALEFLNEMEVILRERLKSESRQSRLSGNIIAVLEDLKKSRHYLFDRVASPKMIIEHFALTLPKL